MRLVVITFLHLRPKPFFSRKTCFYFSFLQIGPGTIEFGTGAKFAVQRISQIGHSLWIGWVPVSSLVPPFKFIHSFPQSNSFTHSNSFNRSLIQIHSLIQINSFTHSNIYKCNIRTNDKICTMNTIYKYAQMNTNLQI